jgi:hypothetical protein
MNAAIAAPQVFIATKPIFDDEQEAKMAFQSGRLTWTPEQEAVTFRKRRNQIIGHYSVVVKAVIGIDTDGAPVYLCQDDFGTIITIPHDMLTTVEKLLYLPDGEPTVYHHWLIQEMHEQDKRRMRMLLNPPPVTVLLTW